MYKSKTHRRLGILVATFLTVAVFSNSATAAPMVGTAGWDGAGLGSATIDWYLGWSDRPNEGLLPGFTAQQLVNEITAAMATWSAVIDVAFNYLGNSIDNPTSDPFGTAAAPVLNIYWDADDHGDGFPFDGRWDPQDGTGSVFAHAWGPQDTLPAGGEIFDGNIHLDADELWVTSGAPSFGVGTTLDPVPIDIQSIVLHELGHSLGLAHSNAAGAAMNPFYFGPQRTLGQDDINSILQLYAPAQSNGGGGGEETPVPEPSTLALLGVAFVFGIGKRLGSKSVE